MPVNNPVVLPTASDITGGMDGHMSEMKGHAQTTTTVFNPFCSITSAFSGMFSGDSHSSGMLSGLESTLSTITQKMASAWTTVKGWYQDFKNWVASKISSLSDGTSSKDQDTISLLSKAKAWGMRVLSGLKDAFAWVANSVSNIVSSMTKAITGAFGAVKLASCGDLKPGMNALPDDITTPDIKTAIASNGKSEQQIISDHLGSSDAMGHVSDFHNNHAANTAAFDSIPPVNDSTIALG